MNARRLIVAALLSVVASVPVLAQRIGAGAGVRRLPDGVQAHAEHPFDQPAPREIVSRDSAWWVPLASAALPGLGQLRLGQNRFVAYMAVEAYALAGWFSGQAAVHRETRAFQALARDVARVFAPSGNNAVGSWDYYELMEKHIESGAYNRGPGPDLIPETDVSTVNGALWLRARQLHWPNPDLEPAHGSAEYNAAISYYNQRSVHPEFEWSWRNAQLEWDDYRQSIRRKNDASREASHYLAVVAVNHLLSTVDAFVTLRLRGGLGAPAAGAGSRFFISASVPLR